MKAIIEIELDIHNDGEYDIQDVEMAILLSIDSAWVIDADRLVVMSKSSSCRITGKHAKKTHTKTSNAEKPN